MLGALLTAVFAFSMNDAHAIDEMECDVTPGMTWTDGACSPLDDVAEDQDEKLSAEHERFLEEREWVITDDTIQVYEGSEPRTKKEIRKDKLEQKKREGLNTLFGEGARVESMCGYEAREKYFVLRGKPKRLENAHYNTQCWCKVVSETSGKSSSWVYAAPFDANWFTKKSKRIQAEKECDKYCRYVCDDEIFFAGTDYLSRQTRDAVIRTFK